MWATTGAGLDYSYTFTEASNGVSVWEHVITFSNAVIVVPKESFAWGLVGVTPRRKQSEVFGGDDGGIDRAVVSRIICVVDGAVCHSGCFHAVVLARLVIDLEVLERKRRGKRRTRKRKGYQKSGRSRKAGKYQNEKQKTQKKLIHWGFLRHFKSKKPPSSVKSIF